MDILLRFTVQYPLFLLHQHSLKVIVISLLNFIPIGSLFVRTFLAIGLNPDNEVSEVLIAGSIIVFE